MNEEIVQQGTGIDWPILAQQTLNQITTPIVLSIGIALSIWIIVLGVAAIRKFVKI
jgi:hypothetical protein